MFDLEVLVILLKQIYTCIRMRIISWIINLVVCNTKVWRHKIFIFFRKSKSVTMRLRVAQPTKALQRKEVYSRRLRFPKSCTINASEEQESASTQCTASQSANIGRILCWNRHGKLDCKINSTIVLVFFELLLNHKLYRDFWITFCICMYLILFGTFWTGF